MVIGTTVVIGIGTGIAVGITATGAGGTITGTVTTTAIGKLHGTHLKSFFHRKKNMKILAASLFAIGISLAGVSASQAMPVAPLDQAASADTVRVAGGCGAGWHRGPYGGCRPMYNCPPGWHAAPFGRQCFRNW